MAQSLNVSVKVPGSEAKEYNVFISGNVFQELAVYVHGAFPNHKIAVVTDKNVKRSHYSELKKTFSDEDVKHEIYSLPAGEKHKTLKNVEKIVEHFLKKGFLRDTVFIAFGGGVVGDMTGFAASIFTRGVPFVQVPTTVLSQVDSSVGGKTGVDSKQGKNLIGTFTQPAAVFAGVETLKTLPEEVYRFGFAEIVKHALIRDAEMFDEISNNVDHILARDSDFLVGLIARNVEIKRKVVEEDERESGLRQILNFGHTIGHSIEKASRFEFEHGEAVAYGIFYESLISVKHGFMEMAEHEKVDGLLRRLELIRPGRMKYSPERIYRYTKSDKKSLGGQPRYVLLRRVGESAEDDNGHSFFLEKDTVVRSLEIGV